MTIGVLLLLVSSGWFDSFNLAIRILAKSSTIHRIGLPKWNASVLIIPFKTMMNHHLTSVTLAALVFLRVGFFFRKLFFSVTFWLSVSLSSNTTRFRFGGEGWAWIDIAADWRESDDGMIIFGALLGVMMRLVLWGRTLEDSSLFPPVFALLSVGCCCGVGVTSWVWVVVSPGSSSMIGRWRWVGESWDWWWKEVAIGGWLVGRSRCIRYVYTVCIKDLTDQVSG